MTRNPTWFSPEEAKKILAKGREVKYARELQAVVDRAMEKQIEIARAVPAASSGVWQCLKRHRVVAPFLRHSSGALPEMIYRC